MSPSLLLPATVLVLLAVALVAKELGVHTLRGGLRVLLGLLDACGTRSAEGSRSARARDGWRRREGVSEELPPKTLKQEKNPRAEHRRRRTPPNATDVRHSRRVFGRSKRQDVRQRRIRASSGLWDDGPRGMRRRFGVILTHGFRPRWRNTADPDLGLVTHRYGGSCRTGCARCGWWTSPSLLRVTANVRDARVEEGRQHRGTPAKTEPAKFRLGYFFTLRVCGATGRQKRAENNSSFHKSKMPDWRGGRFRPG